MEKVVEDDELDPDGTKNAYGGPYAAVINLKNQEGDPGTDGSDMEEGGTLWDVFRMEDTSKLEEYLKKHFKDFRDVFCRPLQPAIKKSTGGMEAGTGVT
ncbi:hypothetical protein L2E82_36194 [Cichorium intybus]|uniref:Uncharacterized protein n=1 Tax=Cichorium intybus TaxID=13427 RepID=A0ACB9BR82_CICIN|nr:hypothetical protein L2E82_36194 [Cichorium intybus]